MAKKKKEIIDNYLQLDLIPPTEIEKLYKEFTEVKESSDKVRRGVFAKHTALSKKVDELTCQIESLQKQLIVMSEYMITRLGVVENAPLQPEESQEITFLRITSINVAYADKRHPSHTREITNIQNLSA
jgi:hypothetical protein